MLEKTRGMDALRPLVRLLAMLPMAVPGLVLGLGYIFFFNAPANPLHGMYQTMALADHLHHRPLLHHRAPDGGDGAEVARRRVRGGERLAQGAVLHARFCRVTLPICTPTLVDIARYFFVNAMTTISAVVFLYSPDTKVAAIAILNLDEAGEAGAAAACAMLITVASTVRDAAVHGGRRAGSTGAPRPGAAARALTVRRGARQRIRRLRCPETRSF